jgi:hypothetical protein
MRDRSGGYDGEVDGDRRPVLGTGSRHGDFAAADAKAGYAETPAGYTWHHSEELGRMYLVPTKLHKAVQHSGGVATRKHVTGDVSSYVN